MTHYTTGRMAEWELKRILEADGNLVTRSAGSHSIDLWAWNKQALRLYEVKSTSNTVYYPSRTQADTNQMVEFVKTCECWGVRGYYAVRFKGGVWRYFPLEDLDGSPLRLP